MIRIGAQRGEKVRKEPDGAVNKSGKRLCLFPERLKRQNTGDFQRMQSRSRLFFCRTDLPENPGDSHISQAPGTFGLIQERRKGYHPAGIDRRGTVLIGTRDQMLFFHGPQRFSQRPVFQFGRRRRTFCQTEQGNKNGIIRNSFVQIAQNREDSPGGEGIAKIAQEANPDLLIFFLSSVHCRPDPSRPIRKRGQGIR